MAKLHIVGAGAIGSLIAAGAEKHGVAYARYPRQHSTIPETVKWNDSDIVSLSAPASTPSCLCQDDVLVLPLKVYQLKHALLAWSSYLENRPPLVLLHNGLGGDEIATSVLGENYPILLATTSHGALKEPDGKTATYTGLGKTQIGLPRRGDMARNDKHLPWVQEASALLNTALPPVDLVDDITRALWQKLAINCVINPLTALNNMRNGGVLLKEYDEIRHALCSEFVTVAAQYGLKFSVEELEKNVLSVASFTRQNYSSMHQDIAMNRHTEIDAINGYIVSLANKKGISVPTHALIVDRIKGLAQ